MLPELADEPLLVCEELTPGATPYTLHRFQGVKGLGVRVEGVGFR